MRGHLAILAVSRFPFPSKNSKSALLRLLEQEKPFLASTYGVTDLALFGSVSRDEQAEVMWTSW